MAECSLDLNGAADQGRRYAAIGSSLERMDREPLRLTARFGPALDEKLLSEALAIERDCCPFFAIEYEGGSRRLSFSVADAEHGPALDAIEAALRG